MYVFGMKREEDRAIVYVLAESGGGEVRRVKLYKLKKLYKGGWGGSGGRRLGSLRVRGGVLSEEK